MISHDTKKHVHGPSHPSAVHCECNEKKVTPMNNPYFMKKKTHLERQPTLLSFCVMFAVYNSLILFVATVWVRAWGSGTRMLAHTLGNSFLKHGYRFPSAGTAIRVRVKRCEIKQIKSNRARLVISLIRVDGNRARVAFLLE